VNATLSTTDPLLTIITATVGHGFIAPGATDVPGTGFRVFAAANTPDGHEFPLWIEIADGAGRVSTQSFQLTLAAPRLQHNRHVVIDQGGDGDGRPDPGEFIAYYVKLQNIGNGSARQVTARLRNHDGLAQVVDSTSNWGDIPPEAEFQGDVLLFTVHDLAAILELRVSDLYGLRFIQRLDLVAPAPPIGLSGEGLTTSIKLRWTPSASADLLGYNVYRSTSPSGPFVRLNPYPTDRVSYYEDVQLPPFTTYHYEVSAVDSSGNESDRLPGVGATTTLPSHTIFPISVGAGLVSSSVAVGHLYPEYGLDIVAGGDVVYALHPDGTAPLDADGSGTTLGDFSTRGRKFSAAPSIGDLDGDGQSEIIAPSWDSTRVYVFDTEGQVKPGWPLVANDGIWSSAAIGDLDGDGTREVVCASNGRNLYVLRADGTEWRDGDGNPATHGVFKVLGDKFNYGTPALADLDRDGAVDIVYGSFDRRLYAWRHDGSNLPGFPITLPGRITASVAIGYLDGPGDLQLDLAVTSEVASQPNGPESLYVFRASGERRAGFPVPFAADPSTQRAPSPALADMNDDGFTDVVVAGTDGGLYVYDRNGAIVPPFNNVRYSIFTAGASEASPVVADIDGDGRNDILMGDEYGQLTAIGGAGGVLPGFPIQLPAEVKSTPAVCDFDGDGMTEILVQSWDAMLHMWDYDFPFSPGRVPPWPQFHHDAGRTGLATNPPFVGVGGHGTIRAAGAVELTAARPNPASSRTRWWYSVPSPAAGGALELAVYDLAGRKVRTLARGHAAAGTHSAEWDLRDQGGAPVGAGVYFIRIKVGGESRSLKLAVAR
jgi:hypothetical protein